MKALRPSFAREGFSAQATVSPTAEWLDELCAWVRRAAGDLGPLGWPVVLMAERIDAAFTRPADARTVYQRVQWDAAISHGPLDLDARPAWVSNGPDGSEIAVISSASALGVELARSEVVVRTGDPLVGWGEPDTPALPDAAGASAKRRLSFALSEHDVAAFAGLTGIHERLHEDPSHAWSLGHPNVLVQELMLLLIVMHVAGAGSAGSVEMWFPAPASVGSLLTLWQGAGRDGAEWEVRSAGTRRVTAVGRLETA